MRRSFGRGRRAVGIGGPATSSQLRPSVAVDAVGNAVVVYEQGNQIWANRYDAKSNIWGTPGAIDSRNIAQYAPRVAVDKSGIYLAVWYLPNDATNMGLWQSTSSDGIHWSASSAITRTNAVTAALSMNSKGAAIVAWTQVVNNLYTAAASIRSTASGAWSTAQILRPGDDSGDRNPVVAMSETGDAFVGWTQSEGGTADYISVWERSYVSGAWQPAALLETEDGGPSYGIGISANATGDAIVTWFDVTGNPATMELWSRRYTHGGTFAAAQSIIQATSLDYQIAPSVTLDDSGVATSAFGVMIGSSYEVFTSQSKPSDAAWPTPTQMETDDIAAEERSEQHARRRDHADRPARSRRERDVDLAQAHDRHPVDLWTRRLPVGGTWGRPCCSRPTPPTASSSRRSPSAPTAPPRPPGTTTMHDRLGERLPLGVRPDAAPPGDALNGIQPGFRAGASVKGYPDAHSTYAALATLRGPDRGCRRRRS